MHTVTRQWIHKHKTPRGSWNQRQLNALGISWPPAKGWIDQTAGMQITDEAAKEFEEGAQYLAKGNEVEIIKRRISRLSCKDRAQITAFLRSLDNG
jgi:hypothetical protein